MILAGLRLKKNSISFGRFVRRVYHVRILCGSLVGIYCFLSLLILAALSYDQSRGVFKNYAVILILFIAVLVNLFLFFFVIAASIKSKFLGRGAYEDSFYLSLSYFIFLWVLVQLRGFYLFVFYIMGHWENPAEVFRVSKLWVALDYLISRECDRASAKLICMDWLRVLILITNFRVFV